MGSHFLLIVDNLTPPVKPQMHIFDSDVSLRDHYHEVLADFINEYVVTQEVDIEARLESEYVEWFDLETKKLKPDTPEYTVVDIFTAVCGCFKHYLSCDEDIIMTHHEDLDAVDEDEEPESESTPVPEPAPGGDENSIDAEERQDQLTAKELEIEVSEYIETHIITSGRWLGICTEDRIVYEFGTPEEATAFFHSKGNYVLRQYTA